MVLPQTIERLRDDLLRADFTLSAVSQRLGAAGLAGLARNSSFPVWEALGGLAPDAASDPQATLIKLWILGAAVDRAEAEAALSVLPELAQAGLVELGQSCAARIELKPYGWGEREGWICSDRTPLDAMGGQPANDFVLGASPASTTLTQLTLRDPVASALDLGTGCGIQALQLSDHCQRIVATDLNPRAITLARLTLGLSLVRADLRIGSLYQPVAGEFFDLIVTNPPYVMTPPAASQLVYREGGLAADELVRTVVTAGAGRLNPGGVLQVLGNWAITSADWRDRLAAWVEPTGCDALIVQREQLDAHEYIELWLADAGMAGAPGYLSAYRDWKAYFDSLGIKAVGMGWINLRQSHREVPEVRMVDWPQPVAHPIAAQIGAFFAAVEPSRMSAAELLGQRWMLAGDVVQTTVGEAGAADPDRIVLRQRAGWCRSVEVGTELAAVLGACDGELALGELLNAVATVLAADAEKLTESLLPQLRELILTGFLNGPLAKS
jgi:methylase of polypeptide subunit release factors